MFSGWLLVVPKNLKSVYTCENGSLGYIVDSKDLSHTKFIIHEAIIKQIHTVSLVHMVFKLVHIVFKCP